MGKLKYITKANTTPGGKPNVYFCGHPGDFEKYFEPLTSDILSKRNCTVWYAEPDTQRDEDFFDQLRQMHLFVMPVTSRLLCTKNETMDTDFPFAMQNHIPVLPLMLEQGLEEIFNAKCGGLHFLNRNERDITAISYDVKLEKYLDSVLFSDGLAKEIREAFDAYIFLSYRKKDRKYANELLKSIHSNPQYRDIAVWFDEFLIPGERFQENIEQQLDECKLFVLVVTPRIAEKTMDEKGRMTDNYVVSTELPMAREKREKKGTDILAVEMEHTDARILQELGVDPCVSFEKESYRIRLMELLSKVSNPANNTPRHSFLIGLAYLGGVDMEINREVAVELITEAAEAGCEPAVSKLVNMYRAGQGVQRDLDKALRYCRKLCSIHRQEFASRGTAAAAKNWIDTQYQVGTLLLELERFGEAEIWLTNMDKNCKRLRTPTIFTWQGRSLLRTAKRFDYALYGRGLANLGLAKIAKRNEDEDRAEDRYTDAVYALEDYEDDTMDHEERRLEDRVEFGLSNAEAFLGWGKPEKALEILEMLRKDTSSYRLNHLIFTCCAELAEKQLARKQFDQALDHYRRASTAVQDMGENDNLDMAMDAAYLCVLCGEIFLQKRKDAQARFGEPYVYAIIDEQTGKLTPNPEVYGSKGYQIRQAEFEMVADAFRTAEEIMEDYMDSFGVRMLHIAFRCFVGQGQLQELKGNREQAAAAYEQACDAVYKLPGVLVEEKWKKRLCGAHLRLAELYEALGDHEKQRHHAVAARTQEEPNIANGSPTVFHQSGDLQG